MEDNANITLPLKELERRFKAMAPTLPRLAGNEVVNFALDNFRKQGFMGSSFRPWKPRKNPTKWGQAPKRNGRSILVQTGRLRRSIRVTQASWALTTIGTDVPYARAHNEGLRMGQIQTVKGFTRKKTAKRKAHAVDTHTRRINQNIPARPFLADSPYLQRNIQRVLAAQILKALKPTP